MGLNNNNAFGAGYNLKSLESEFVSAEVKEDKEDNRSLRVKVMDYFETSTNIQPVHYKDVAEILEEKDFSKVKKELDIQTNEGYLYNRGNKYGKKPSHKIIV